MLLQGVLPGAAITYIVESGRLHDRAFRLGSVNHLWPEERIRILMPPWLEQDDSGIVMGLEPLPWGGNR